MSRSPGFPKTGGRKKGTPNKKTLVLLERLHQNNFDVVDELVQIIPSLDKDKKVAVLLSLLPYLYAKRGPLHSWANPCENGEVPVFEEAI